MGPSLFIFQLCWHSGIVNNRVGMSQAQNANQRLAAVLPAVERVPGYKATPAAAYSLGVFNIQ